MGMYLDRPARVVPPRQGTGRVIACNASTTAVQLDNDIFQFPAPANTVGVPGSVGRALVQCVADGGDIWVLFGTTNAVAANSAATNAATNTIPDYIPAGKAMIYELDPQVDKWISARTANGGSATATLRYRIISPPSHANP